MQISEETLMAYADGELDAAAAAQVEAAIRGDPELAARLARQRTLRARLRDAFDAELAEPVPQRLVDAAMRPAPAASKVVPLDAARQGRAGRAGHAFAWRRASLPLAAAASLLLGIGAGFLAWHSSGVMLREDAR